MQINNIVHHRFGDFRTFLWFYEPALRISGELSPPSPEHNSTVSSSDMLNPDRPVQISSALQGNQTMINNMMELASSSATHSPGLNKCGQMRRNGELFQLMFNHGLIPTQNTTRFNIRLLIGLLQQTITWYKIRHVGGQAHYYSRTGMLKQRPVKLDWLRSLCFNVSLRE